MPQMPTRCLADWTDDAGPVDAWLARWAAAGWVPEYSWGGSETEVNGRAVTRWAMIRAVSADDDRAPDPR